MEIWLDATNLQSVENASQLGVIHGVTTYMLMNQAANVGHLQSLLEAQSGPVAALIMGESAAEMVRLGDELYAYSNRIIAKIPVTREGLSAMHQLSKKNIPVMATAVFDPNQALLAARVGAHYIAPYFSQICEADQNGISEMRAMIQMAQRYRYPSKIIATSLRSTEQVRECFDLGMDAVMVNETLFDEFLANHPLTIKTINRDWKKSGQLPQAF